MPVWDAACDRSDDVRSSSRGGARGGRVPPRVVSPSGAFFSAAARDAALEPRAGVGNGLPLCMMVLTRSTGAVAVRETAPATPPEASFVASSRSAARVRILSVPRSRSRGRVYSLSASSTNARWMKASNAASGLAPCGRRRRKGQLRKVTRKSASQPDPRESWGKIRMNCHQ